MMRIPKNQQIHIACLPILRLTHLVYSETWSLQATRDISCINQKPGQGNFRAACWVRAELKAINSILPFLILCADFHLCIHSCFVCSSPPSYPHRGIDRLVMVTALYFVIHFSPKSIKSTKTINECNYIDALQRKCAALRSQILISMFCFVF